MKENEVKLLANKWMCKDGTILHSKYRYDYVTHTDANGEFYFLDGGTDYIRHSGNLEPMLVYTSDPHEVIRENFGWTSYGVNGDEPAKYNLLKELSVEHMKAILKTQKHLPKYILDLFRNELEYRQLTKEYIMEPTQTITISTREYEQLIEDQLWLQCLEEAGVDNWQGMEVAIDIKREYNKDES